MRICGVSAGADFGLQGVRGLNWSALVLRIHAGLLARQSGRAHRSRGHERAWYDHVSFRGRVVEIRADEDWADLDAVCRHYRGLDYRRDTDFHPSTVIVAVNTWHEFHLTTRS
jgi:hypothetical protein